MRGFVALALILGACSFSPGALPADGGPDGPPPLTIGFAKDATLADEDSGVVSIRVVLSAPADQAVNVVYSIVGNTASKNTDFTGADGLLTFAPGDVEEVIEVTILPDSLDEPDETLSVKLSNVSDPAVSLGIKEHTLTISANVLPRVSFATTTSMGAEDTSAAFDVVLDRAATVPITVNLLAAGASTATGGGVDYDLSTTTVNFAIGEMTKQVMLTVNNDTLDEIDENAILSLDSPTAAILASSNTMRTHTIEDNDLPPTISFAAGASSSLGEAGTMVDLTVSLSTASGKDISVPFAVDGASSATATTDYTLGTTTPLAFPAGMTSKTIRINVVQDTASEVDETVVLTLGPLDTSFVTAGANTTHTLTIGDDDPVCLGTGAFAACFLTPTTATANLSGTIDTTNSSLCSTTAPSMWTGQPASCFVVAQTINVASALTVTGNKPLVLWASGAINITANIDASSHRGGTSGPAANSSLCTAYTDNPVNSDGTNGGGGGAGGSFRSAGGNGGDGGIAAASAGSATGAVGAPTVLRGGCAGQNGGTGEGNAGAGPGGAGGGALYIVAGGVMKIDGSAIAANGASGVAAGQRAGGGGGGSGGMIRLTAASFNILNAPRIMANGGGASSAGDDNQGGNSGTDPSLATPLSAAAGGTNTGGGGAGGNGFAGVTQATGGTSDSGSNGGGGGGGGGGHVESSATLTGAVVSTGP